MDDSLWTLGQAPWIDREPRSPRARVIVDNDFAGDPDDLYQLVHHLLSPSVEIPLIVCSHLREGDPFCPNPDSAEAAEEVVRNLYRIMRLGDSGEIVRGRVAPWSAAPSLNPRPAPRRSFARPCATTPAFPCSRCSAAASPSSPAPGSWSRASRPG